MKRITALLLTLALLLCAAGCAPAASSAPGAPQSQADSGEAAEPPAPTEAPAESADAPQASAYPLTLTDQAGRSVTLEEQPERLVSGYYISTSLLIALGQQDKLVGIEAKADKRAIYRLSAPELLELPNVGSAKEFDLEGCAALEPDLVILPLKLKNAADTLAELGIPVLLVNPESEELLEETVRLVAAATGSAGGAQALEAFRAEQQAWLEQTLADAPRPKVYLAGNSSLLSTAGGQMYQSGMIELAGGSNVAQELPDDYWAEVDYEQLLAWDPDYIVLASDASYTCEDVLNDPNLAGCTAVAQGNVCKLPDRAEAWDSPVPSGILGSVWLAGVLHPDLCAADDCAAVIEEYYDTFYGFSYSESGSESGPADAA